ncbi:MAG: rod shape-determining protein MreC [Candidatus Sericytochromatia bacterium]|nr:MAG: rod shape-determining protein MreC [Candidatus Sericytochromatia bacterium]
MLWEYLNRYKVFFSLSFCILFSLISIIWQKNPISNSSVYFNKIAEQTNYFFKNIFNFPFLIIERISEYSELKEKYKKSLEEIEKYKLQKEQYEILLKENQKLRQLLEFEPLTNYQEVKAEVLGIRLNSITPRIIINKGKKHGIKPFMPVIAFATDENNNPIRTVVGIIAIVQNTSSIIQPIQHPQMKLGVKIENTNQWAILEGDSFSFNKLKLKYITSSSAKESKYFIDPYIELRNSKVVTSGNDGIFPPNIPVGIIIEKGNIDENNFATAYLKPYIEIDKLEYVMIIQKNPELWSQELTNEIKNELPIPLTTEYIPMELIDNYKNKLENKLNNKTEKENKTNDDTNKNILNQLDNKENTKDNNSNTIKKLINPNDPFQ